MESKVFEENSHSIWKALPVPIILLFLMWMVQFVQNGIDVKLTYLGVYPLSFHGLIGVITSPLVHNPYDLKHIINNSSGIFVLSWALYYFYKNIANGVLLTIWLTSGMLVWLSARANYHIGMSGVIYGLAFFLFISGVLRKKKELMGVSLIISFLYGGMVWGIFPYDMSISFEGHLWGGVIGAVLAYMYREKGPQRKKYQWELDEESEGNYLEEYGHIPYNISGFDEGEMKVTYTIINDSVENDESSAEVRE